MPSKKSFKLEKFSNGVQFLGQCKLTMTYQIDQESNVAKGISINT